MAAPKAQTLQQRFGFADTQLSTPAHDQLMCALDAKIEGLIRARFRKAAAEELKRCMVEYEKLGYHMSPEEWANWAQANVPEPHMIAKRWEHPVMNGKFMVGFVDMKLEVYAASVAVCEPEWGKSTHSLWAGLGQHYVSIEVKSSIPSVGELIRQVRMYQEYGNCFEIFAVASPDTQWISVLLDQGIEFIDTGTWEWHHR